MIILRMARGVTDHFPARRPEWVLAAMLAGWGVILGMPTSNVFELVPAFSGLKAIASEVIWAWICLLLGSIRLLALIVNGTFYTTAYGRFSPHVRGALAFLSCFIWTAISVSTYSSELATTGLVIYPGLLFLEFTNVMAAVQDAAEVDRSHADAAT
jgi:hypothetical protein